MYAVFCGVRSGLHYLLRPICTNCQAEYGNFGSESNIGELNDSLASAGIHVYERNITLKDTIAFRFMLSQLV